MGMEIKIEERKYMKTGYVYVVNIGNGYNSRKFGEKIKVDAEL